MLDLSESKKIYYHDGYSKNIVIVKSIPIVLKGNQGIESFTMHHAIIVY